MRTILLIIFSAILVSISLHGFESEIKGKINTVEGQTGIPFAIVMVFKDSNLVLTTTADKEGNYILSPLKPGLYNVNVSSTGYNPKEIVNVKVVAGKNLKLNIQLALIAVESDSSSSNETTIAMYNEVEEPVKMNSAPAVTYDRNTLRLQKFSLNSSGADQPGYSRKGIREQKRKFENKIAEAENEQYDLIVENDFLEVNRHPLSTFSIDVDAASYSNIRRFLTQGYLPPKDAVRIEEMINYFSYDYPQPHGEDPFSISTEMSTCPWNEQHRLIHIGLNGKSIPTQNLPPSNLVFLIDVSGSMDQPNKLPLLKNAFQLLVEQLRHEDKVAIVVYAGNAGLVLPSTRGDRKEKILTAIDELEAGGSTAGGAGIELAYRVAKENFIREGNNRVILATDGDFNVGISGDAQLIRLIEEKRNDGVFLTVLGFGVGNYKDGKMEKLADKGNGNFSYIDNIMEANKVFVREIGATLNTIAKDVKLQIEFNPSKVKAYRLVGYENRVLADEDFNDDKKDAGDLGSGHTVTALYEIIPAGSEEPVNSIDPLKYQKIIPEHVSDQNNELMTVKFRYKDPDANKSKLIVHPLMDEHTELGNTSDNFRFSAAAAEFGMLLRNSKFKGESNYRDLLALSRGSKGNDAEGYRAEFIRLVETAELLSKGVAQK